MFYKSNLYTQLWIVLCKWAVTQNDIWVNLHVFPVFCVRMWVNPCFVYVWFYLCLFAYDTSLFLSMRGHLTVGLCLCVSITLHKDKMVRTYPYFSPMNTLYYTLKNIHLVSDKPLKKYWRVITPYPTSCKYVNTKKHNHYLSLASTPTQSTALQSYRAKEKSQK